MVDASNVLSGIWSKIHIIIPVMLALYLLTAAGTIGAIHMTKSSGSSPRSPADHPAAQAARVAYWLNKQEMNGTIGYSDTTRFIYPDIAEHCDFDDLGNPIQKSQTGIWVLAWLLGGLGVARFVTGYCCFGTLQCLSCGCFGVWWLVDVILILAASYVESNGCPLDYDLIYHQLDLPANVTIALNMALGGG